MQKKMAVLQDYLMTIDDPIHRQQLIEVFEWVLTEFPQLETKIAWNQPMFTDHDTFIAGFSVAKKHFAFAPEGETIDAFADTITEAGYDMGKKFMRILWTQEVNYDLLREMIAFNISEKADCKTFWRK